MEPIILASSSPRRQEILKLLHIPFQVVMPNVDETTESGLDVSKVPEILAKRKIDAVVRMLPPKQEIPWVLGADTIVTLDGKIYGKPTSQDQAVSYLKTLQGRTHSVITSVVLFNGRKHNLPYEYYPSYVQYHDRGNRLVCRHRRLARSCRRIPHTRGRFLFYKQDRRDEQLCCGLAYFRAI